MSKTFIDVDEELLAQAAELLCTKTKKDTVNQALSEYVRYRLRMSFGERLASGGLPDLADPEIMARACRIVPSPSGTASACCMTTATST